MAAGLTAPPRRTGALFARSALLVALTASGPWTVSVAAEEGFRERDKAVLEAINAIRSDNGTAALVMEEAAVGAAGAHAGELAGRRTLSHRGLDGSRVNERYRRAGGTALISGEILAAGDSLEDITAGWMQSVSHRESLLNPRWTSAGVGSRNLGSGRMLVVAVFTESRWRTRSLTVDGDFLLLKGTVVGTSLRERAGAYLAVDGSLLRPEADTEAVPGEGAVVFRIRRPAAWENGGIATAFFGFDRDERPSDLVLLPRP